MHDCVPFAFGDESASTRRQIPIELSMHVALCLCMLSSPIAIL